MKRITKIAFAMLSVVAISSCKKEIVPTPDAQTGKSHPGILKDGDLQTKIYHYSDATYEVTAEITHDDAGNVSAQPVKNDAFYAVKEIMEGMEDVGMLFEDDINIHLYANANELEDAYKRIFPKQSLEARELKDLDAGIFTCLPYYKIYRHAGYSELLYDAQNGSGMLGECPTLNPNYCYYGNPWVGNNNNDQISSLVVHGGTIIGNVSYEQSVTLYKDIDYGGDNITFFSNGCHETVVWNLKDYWIWQFFFFGENWNDEVSSFKGHFWVY